MHSKLDSYPTPDIRESKSLYCPNIYTVLVGFLQKQSSVPGGGGLQNPELPIYLELEFSSHTVILLD